MSANGSSAGSTTRPLVRDIMIGQVHTVHQDAPMNHAASVMGQYGIRHLVVINGMEQPVGIISERDLLRHIAHSLSRGVNVPGRVPVRELMISVPFTVRPETPLARASAILATKKIGCVPVVDDRTRLAGIISVVDVLKYVAAHELSEKDILAASEP